MFTIICLLGSMYSEMALQMLIIKTKQKQATARNCSNQWQLVTPQLFQDPLYETGDVFQSMFHVFENQWPMNITLVQNESDIQKYDLVRRDIRDRKR